MCEAVRPGSAVRDAVIDEMADMRIDVIRGAALTAVPWKNGGGVTREIAASPNGATFDTFDWRVSVADVAQSGAFSTFTGIDRVLTVIDGAAMVLVDDTGERAVLERLAPHAFAGEQRVCAELPQGATRDFNLMMRRDRASGGVSVRRDAQRLVLAEGAVVLYCAAGAFDVSAPCGEFAPFRLTQSDALRIEGAHGHTIDIAPVLADAALLDARIVPSQRVAA
jgi:uncharacterized protein